MGFPIYTKFLTQPIILLVDMCFVFFYLLVMWNFSKELTIITIGITFVIAIFSFFNAKINRKISENEMGVLTNSQDLINELVNNIFTIKSTNSQNNMFIKWENNYEKQIVFEKKKLKLIRCWRISLKQYRHFTPLSFIQLDTF
ncbi:ABC transporter transmembrane domain-containing protein [Vagococcus acidifermentans]|uniref:ABC transmembrane type-1 domain-containing protein n=1 Tax=Vagococcus acidifermentans TaxID=564710 RepID=A0A430APB6_9ENTE|nr:hypothetical protein CBF27_11740 [Vagococcus acidifermentans]